MMMDAEAYYLVWRTYLRDAGILAEGWGTLYRALNTMRGFCYVCPISEGREPI
jgi:hypothetical protein